MPIHDWTRVSAGTFHDFHMAWIAELRKALNGGLLAVGDSLPSMPLFLDPTRYVSVPLEAAYQESFLAGPQPWREAVQ